MGKSPTIIGGLTQAPFTKWVVAAGYGLRHSINMMDTGELLARLDAKKVRNVDIAKALGLPDSRVPEIKRRERALKLDEAVKLVQAFELEQAELVSPLPASVLRLLVRYVALVLGAPQERVDARLAELTEDLRAFSEFVADPKVRRSVDAAEGFFQAMLRRRPPVGSEAPPGNDPARTH